MKYDHTVKHNGKIYPAGTEVPVGGKAAEPKEDAVMVSEPASVPKSTEENDAEEQKSYNKSDISRMNVENLKELAAELGLEVTEESTGKALKEEIIAKLGL